MSCTVLAYFDTKDSFGWWYFFLQVWCSVDPPSAKWIWATCRINVLHLVLSQWPQPLLNSTNSIFDSWLQGLKFQSQLFQTIIPSVLQRSLANDYLYGVKHIQPAPYDPSSNGCLKKAVQILEQWVPQDIRMHSEWQDIHMHSEWLPGPLPIPVLDHSSHYHCSIPSWDALW